MFYKEHVKRVTQKLKLVALEPKQEKPHLARGNRVKAPSFSRGPDLQQHLIKTLQFQFILLYSHCILSSSSYLPALVMIISVPTSSNFVQSSLS